MSDETKKETHPALDLSIPVKPDPIIAGLQASYDKFVSKANDAINVGLKKAGQAVKKGISNAMEKTWRKGYDRRQAAQVRANANKMQATQETQKAANKEQSQQSAGKDQQRGPEKGQQQDRSKMTPRQKMDGRAAARAVMAAKAAERGEHGKTQEAQTEGRMRSEMSMER